MFYALLSRVFVHNFHNIQVLVFRFNLLVVHFISDDTVLIYTVCG